MKQTLTLALIGLLLVAAHPRAQSTPPRSSMLPAEVKAAFLKQLDRPRVPLDVKAEEAASTHRGVTKQRVDFAVQTRPDGTVERVPALVVRPDWAKPEQRLPAVIVLHGTGGRKEGSWPWIERLAHHGFLAIAIDGRFHGERALGQPGTAAYNDAIIAAWHARPGDPQARPFYFDTCWDVWRTVHFLYSRGDVDPERIGLIGISKGGIETWLAGAVDDRIKVAIPAIAVQSFRWSLEHDRWQARANTIRPAHEAVAADLGEPSVNAKVCRALWSKVIPGILDEFDAPSMLRLFAGRSLMILNGAKDPNCPIEGAELAIASARAAFREVDAEDHLKVIVAPEIGHSVTREQQTEAVDWCVTWLKPPTPPAGAWKPHPRRTLAQAPVVGPPRPGRPEHPHPARRPFGRRAQSAPSIAAADAPPAAEPSPAR